MICAPFSVKHSTSGFLSFLKKQTNKTKTFKLLYHNFHPPVLPHCPLSVGILSHFHGCSWFSQLQSGDFFDHRSFVWYPFSTKISSSTKICLNMGWPAKIRLMTPSHFLQARQPFKALYLNGGVRCIVWKHRCDVWDKCLSALILTMIDWHMQMYPKLIWVETLHSTTIFLTACMKVEVLKLSLHQSRSNLTILWMIAEWHVSHERYKLLCHKITCVRCTLLPTATERSLYVGWCCWIIICLNGPQGERARCAGWARLTFNKRVSGTLCWQFKLVSTETLCL